MEVELFYNKPQMRSVGMDQRNEKIILYLKVIFLTLLYVGQRHPCTTAGLLVWCIGCIGIAVSESFLLGTSLIVGGIGMAVFLRGLFAAVEDFGSERKKMRRRLKKREAFERYLKYLEESRMQ